MSSPCLHHRGGGCQNHHVNSPSASLVQGQWYPTTILKLSYKKSLPSYKGWIILTTYFNSMNFKLYLNLRENREQRKPTADEDVPTVGSVYKKPVWAAQTVHGSGRGNSGEVKSTQSSPPKLYLSNTWELWFLYLCTRVVCGGNKTADLARWIHTAQS